jgi:hypothetical protein
MLVSPQYAGLLMAFSSLSVVLSSLSLRLYKRPTSSIRIENIEKNLATQIQISAVLPKKAKPSWRNSFRHILWGLGAKTDSPRRSESSYKKLVESEESELEMV